MSSNRRISLSTHSSIAVVVGAGLMFAALPLGLSSAGILTTVALGAILVGVGLAPSGSAEFRPPVPVSVLAAYHHWLGVAMLVAGSALGLAGDVTALTLLVPLGLAQLVLVQSTRYAPVAA